MRGATQRPGTGGPGIPGTGPRGGPYGADVINPRAERAVYQQIADLLRHMITSGQVVPGALLPSSKTLEQTHGVSRETIRRALAVLRAEGLIVTEGGYGTRVREPVERERVRVPRGATVTSRPASVDERDELDIPVGGYVFVVEIGGRERILSADRTTLTFS